MPMSELVKKNYLSRGGTTCPYCGSRSISGEAGCHCDFTTGAMHQNIGCNSCHTNWTDKYILVGILESQEE
jgi:transposase-like protein